MFFLHELGHLQTVPFLAAFLPVVLRRRRPGLRARLLDIVTLQAFWELATETYVVLRARREYLPAIRQARNPAAFLFWPVMGLLAALPFLRRPVR